MPAAKNPVATRKTTATPSMFQKSDDAEVFEPIPEPKAERIKKTFYISADADMLLLDLQRHLRSTEGKKPDFSDLADRAIKLLANEVLSTKSDAA